MKIEEFIESTVCAMDVPATELLKEILFGEYLTFSFLQHNRINNQELAEKVFDYFTMVEIKTGRSFDKTIDAYLSDTDAITGYRIAKAPQPKKGEKTSMSNFRAQKYYEHAMRIKGNKDLSVTALLDYARIMLCLYSSSVNAGNKAVENIDLSLKCIDPNGILAHMKEEEVQILFPPGKKKRFDLKERFGSDASTMVITAIALCAMINGRIQGGANQ